MVLGVLKLEKSSFCRVRVDVGGALPKGCYLVRLLGVVFIVRSWLLLLWDWLLLFSNWRRCLNRALLLRCEQGVWLRPFNKTFHELVLLLVSEDFTHDFSLVLVIDFSFWLANMEGILHLMLSWWIRANSITSCLWRALWFCFFLSLGGYSCWWELHCWPSWSTLEA